MICNFNFEANVKAKKKAKKQIQIHVSNVTERIQVPFLGRPWSLVMMACSWLNFHPCHIVLLHPWTRCFNEDYFC